MSGNRKLLVIRKEELEKIGYRGLLDLIDTDYSSESFQPFSANQKGYSNSFIFGPETSKNTDAQSFLRPVNSVRTSGVPVGLMNIGNTCYFNSLIQTYYMNWKFVEEVLSFNEPADLNERIPRLKTSIHLVKSLKLLFAKMISSDRKFVDPSEVLKIICEPNGDLLTTWEQKDIGEFNFNFLEKIEEGLQYEKLEAQLSKKQYEPQELAKIDSGNSNSSDMDTGKLLLLKKKSSMQMRLKRCLSGQNDSIIKKLYFIRMKKKIEFVNEKDEQIVKEYEEKFNSIMLDISHKSLDQSLEAFFNRSKLEGYKTDLGNIVPAEQSYRIKNLPSTLMFQLHRVVSDKSTGRLRKLNDRFTFGKEIYIDQFLEENQEELNENEELVKTLKLRIQKIENALEQLKNYDGKKASLDNYIDSFAVFLKSQEKQSELRGEEEEHLEDPTNLGISQADINPFFSLLDSFRAEIPEKVKRLELRLESTKLELEKALNRFRKHKYRLLSIIVHDGIAASGHYYTFINDFEHDKWRRYNDINITDEQEKRVFEESFGGVAERSAYCLYYVKSEAFFPENIPLGKSIRNYTNHFESESDLYDEYLIKAGMNELKPKKSKKVTNLEEKFALLFEIDQELALEVSLQVTYSLNKTNDEISSQLLNFIEGFESKIKRKYKEFPCDSLKNFSCFLLFKLRKMPSEEDLDNIICWHILDCLLKQVTPKQFGLNNLEKFPREFKLCFNKIIDVEPLSPSQTKIYKQLISEYQQKTKNATLYNRILTQVVKENTDDALLILHFLKAKFSECKEDLYSKSARQLETRLLIKLCSKILFDASFGDAEKSLVRLGIIAEFIQDYNNENEIFGDQLRMYLIEVEEILSEKDTAVYEKAKKIIESINNGHKSTIVPPALQENYEILEELMCKVEEMYDPMVLFFEDEFDQDYLINNIIALREQCETALNSERKLLEEIMRAQAPLSKAERNDLGFM